MFSMSGTSLSFDPGTSLYSLSGAFSRGFHFFKRPPKTRFCIVSVVIRLRTDTSEHSHCRPSQDLLTAGRFRTFRTFQMFGVLLSEGAQVWRRPTASEDLTIHWALIGMSLRNAGRYERALALKTSFRRRFDFRSEKLHQ